MITWQKVRVIQLSSVRKSRGSLSSHFFADIWFLLRNGVQTGPPYFEKVWRPIPNTSTFSIPREASPRTLFFWLYIIQYSYHHHQRCRQQTYKRPNQSLIWPTVSFEMSWTYPASATFIPDFLLHLWSAWYLISKCNRYIFVKAEDTVAIYQVEMSGRRTAVNRTRGFLHLPSFSCTCQRIHKS